ncbi:MAG: PIN domain-containing protein [Planctomycetia bacterium]|nr:PIN domain-containing protein [Planctomycetia bacterium]
MYLPDVNVWVALAFPAHVHHQSARDGFSGESSAGRCHFCRVTQLGFLRIANNPSALPDSAVTQDQAWKLFDHFISHSRIQFANEPGGIESQLRQWTQFPRYSPNSWSDAYLAAFALAADFELITFDKGFAQYNNLRHTILS